MTTQATPPPAQPAPDPNLGWPSPEEEAELARQAASDSDAPPATVVQRPPDDAREQTASGPRPVQIASPVTGTGGMDVIVPANAQALEEFHARVAGKAALVQMMVRLHGGKGWVKFGDKAYPEGWLAAKFMGSVPNGGIRLRQFRRDRIVPTEPTECGYCKGRGVRDYDGRSDQCRKCSGKGARRVAYHEVTAEAFYRDGAGREHSLGDFTGRHNEADYTEETVNASAAAEQNLKSRLVRDLFDLGDLSWDELLRMGVRPSAAAESDKFQGGARGGRGKAAAGGGDRVPGDSPLWKAHWGKLRTLDYTPDAIKAHRAKLEADGVTVAQLRHKLDEMQREIDAKAKT